MKKRSIGVHINNDNMFTVRLCRRGGDYHIEKITCVPLRRASDSPADLLKNMYNCRCLQRCAVGISVPFPEVFFYKNEHKANHKKLDNTLKNYSSNKVQRLENKRSANNIGEGVFPLPADKIFTDECKDEADPNNITDNIRAAVSAEELLKLQSSLQQQGRVRLALIDSPVFALHTAVVSSYPDTDNETRLIAYTDSSDLIIIISRGNNILAARKLPYSQAKTETKQHKNQQSYPTNTADDNMATVIHEIEITWHSSLKGKIPENTPVILAGDLCSDVKLISVIQQEFHCEIRLFQPDIYKKCAPDIKQRKLVTNTNNVGNDDNNYNAIAPEIAIAHGLAIRTLDPKYSPGVNFLENLKVQPTDYVSRKRDIVLCLILLVAVIAISIASIFVQKNQLENQYSSIKNKISQLFRQNLPSEKNIVDELSQMENALHKKQQEYFLIAPSVVNFVNPLAILNLISDHTPDNLSITLQSINITNSEINLSGVGPSFEAVYKWQKLLQKISAFQDVKLLNPHKIAQNDEVAFGVVINISGRQEK